MATIHHATTTRATKFGVILTEVDGLIKAHHPATNRVVYDAQPRVALQAVLLAARFGSEYPMITVSVEEGAVIISHTDSDEPLATVEADEADGFNIDGVFAQALEAAQDVELALEVEDTDEDEEKASGSVVPSKYRKLYAERGNAANCGDWLAGWLDGRYTIEGKFSRAGFSELLAANGIELVGKWATASGNGADGRFRMNGRQKLVKRIATTEQFVDEAGNKVAIDADWLATQVEKFGH